jgi:hypothetical protein
MWGAGSYKFLETVGSGEAGDGGKKGVNSQYSIKSRVAFPVSYSAKRFLGARTSCPQ